MFSKPENKGKRKTGELSHKLEIIEKCMVWRLARTFMSLKTLGVW